jgi:mono/diheme cytochrome c family protein
MSSRFRVTAGCTLAIVLAAMVPARVTAQAGPYQRQTVDAAAADRGKKLYSQFCINCHGALAKGTENGPDLIRSVPVLRDRLGSELGPALKKAANHKADLTASQVVDLSHFLKQYIEQTVRNRNASRPPNVLTGNASAGRAYFNGAGKCSTCHSPAGDLAGVGKKYDPVTLQQRFLFPRTARERKPIQVTVTPPSGPPVSGTLERIDDFNVSLRDASGAFHGWRRVPELKVELRDPYAAHDELLDQYTDTDMHNIVAYLETLK